MGLTCHVKYKNTKKILTAETSGEIMESIKRTFQISCDIAVQKYSTDFEDWVDVEANEIEDMCKLNVIEQQESILQEEDPGRDLGLTGDMDVPVQALHRDSAVKISQRAGDDGSAQVAAEDKKLTDASIRQRAVKLSNWPVPFKLPADKYRPNLKAALSARRPLQYAEKQCLVDALYDEVTKYTFRPSSQQYQEVVSTILGAYPWLRNGLLGQDAVDYWKKIVSNKFRNERKRNERDNPLAQPPKKMKPAAKSSHQDKANHAKGKSLFGIKHYLPLRPEGEDDETIAEHIHMLKKESKKKRQDICLIKELMDITLAERRMQIVTNNWTVQQIKEEYPCLLDSDEMFAEFQRLTEINIQPRMEESLTKYGDAIITCCRAGDPTKDEVEAFLALATSEETKERIRSYGALLLLPQMFGEKVDLVICPQGKEHDGPSAHIQHTGQDNSFRSLVGDDVRYTLVTEGEAICTTSDLVRAFSLLLCIHYAFNLIYDKKVNHTLVFLQKVLVNVVDQTSTPAKVVRFLYKLNTFLVNAEQ